MNTKEKIKVMQHFEDGGEVEYKEWCNSTSQWHLVETNEPIWSWARCDYSIKPKKVELWYEWITQKDNQYVVCVHSEFITEDLARKMFKGNETLEKTGRYFNPVTKEFGVE